LRIAEIAPLYESVPPKLYGGTERIVSYITEELVRQGHDVTLFASGDSRSSARLVSSAPRALRLDPDRNDSLAAHVCQLEDVFADTSRFDLMHFHVDYTHFPLSSRHTTPHLTTLHGRLDLPHLVPVFQRFHDMPVVSISDAQRAPLPWIGWAATVYHGLPLDLYALDERPGEYLAFLGRISPEKRLDWAIEIARRAGMPLRVAAKVDPADRAYFEQTIEPLLAQPHVDYIGEIGEDEKSAFLGRAKALLFPIDWPEPFGLVMIEAFACGTPVVAYRRGSVPEVIDDGWTGFIVDGMDEAVEACARAADLDRRRCRQRFEERFSVERMARDYVDVYQEVVQCWPLGRRKTA
jgi:glycosyltransferase involved in cell wall biosynthesis